MSVIRRTVQIRILKDNKLLTDDSILIAINLNDPNLIDTQIRGQVLPYCVKFYGPGDLTELNPKFKYEWSIKMTGDKITFMGGLYDIANNDRTDITLIECEEVTIGEQTIPFTFNLNIVSGNISLTLVEISPEALEDLGVWLQQEAKRGIDIKRYLK